MSTARIKKDSPKRENANKTIVFLLPGDIFSHNFLMSWTRTLVLLPDWGITPQVRWTIGSNIYKIRNDILMGKDVKGKDQQPFEGKLKYDYLMWVDSDQVWDPAQFKRLYDTMEANPNLHILSGVYIKNNNRQYVSVINKDHPDFPGHKAGFLLPEDLRDKKKLIEVEFTGMGFMMVRYGVFEALDYPWFVPLSYSYLNDTVIGYTSEDAGFSKRARDAGFPTFIDPTIIVGHEKPVILR